MGDIITKEMNLKELLSKYPDSARIFASYGIGCIGCALANYETIEEGIAAHGLNVDDFVKDLNAYVESKN